jgi:ATP-dependent DNA helicase RecQ
MYVAEVIPLSSTMGKETLSYFTGQRFDAGHIIDILRGKANDKIQQHGHASLSTYGIGQDLSESQWRGVVRQLLAQGCLSAEGDFNTLALAGPARAVLKGEQSIWLRVAQAPTPKAGRLRKGSSATASTTMPMPPRKFSCAR